MRMLVDAQLPYSLATHLRSAGHDALHTLDLPGQNKTPDFVINQLAVTEQRIVISKDKDFLDSHLLQGLPPQLLFIVTGNISNPSLLQLFQANLGAIEQLFESETAVVLDLFGVRKR